MTLSTLPIWIVDITGSVMMIILAVACLKASRQLRIRGRNNVIWEYLVWVCYALTLFAISRSAGHILKQILMMVGREDLWEPVQPISGALNSFSFMLVASVTLFFERTWRIYKEILSDKVALQSIRDELLYVNQNLEDMVAERTARLTQSEQKYRRIFESSKDIILATARDGSVLNLNPIGCETLGIDYPNGGIGGVSFSAFFAKPGQWRQIQREIDTSGAVSNAEIELKRANGSEFRALATASLTHGMPDGEDTIHYLIKDIEQRRLMEVQMAQADKLASIGELSAGIAHEINNPLGIILGYTQLLIRGEQEGTEKYQDLRTIEKHVQNCKSIVEDLLNFARSSNPEKSSVNVHQLIDDVIDFIQQHGRSRQLSIERRYDQNLPDLILDDKKIRQVFMNLIMNAKHAVADKGLVSISTRWDEAGQRAIIKVQDDGYGIEKVNMQRIFDPFFTTKPTGEGTGLGLSVSYGIIKSHGGHIEVKSRLGEGTIFTVILPKESRSV